LYANIKTFPDEIFLKEKYVKEGLAAKEIGTLTFSSRSKLSKFSNRFDISIKVQNRKNTGSHVFGYRQYGGRAIVFKNDQKIIESIKSHRSNGYSYQKIANVLDQNKVETKQGKESF
jgi:hypothetical protein